VSACMVRDGVGAVGGGGGGEDERAVVGSGSPRGTDMAFDAAAWAEISVAGRGRPARVPWNSRCRVRLLSLVQRAIFVFGARINSCLAQRAVYLVLCHVNFFMVFFPFF
jgi:hypothetical protein